MFYAGQPAPDVGSGITFRDGGPIIGTSNGPQLAGARVRLQGSGITASNARALYRGGPDAYEMVARAGDTIPGLPNDVVVSSVSNPFTDLGADAVGRFAFTAQLSGAGINSTNDLQSFAVDEFGNVAPLVRKGAQAPGFPAGVTMQTPAAVAFREDGSVVLKSSLTGGAVSNAIFAGDPSAIEPLATAYTPGGINVADLGAPQLNSSGQIVVNGQYERAVYDDTTSQWQFYSRQSVVRDNPTVERVATSRDGTTLGGKSVTGLPSVVFGLYDNVQIVAQVGQPAIGLPGVSYSAFNEFEVGDWGGVFMALLQGSGVDATNNAALFTADSDGLKLLLRLGVQAPGLMDGAIVKSWPSSFRVNNVGSFRIDGVTVDYHGSELDVVYALDPLTKQLTPDLENRRLPRIRPCTIQTDT